MRFFSRLGQRRVRVPDALRGQLSALPREDRREVAAAVARGRRTADRRLADSAVLYARYKHDLAQAELARGGWLSRALILAAFASTMVLSLLALSRGLLTATMALFVAFLALPLAVRAYWRRVQRTARAAELANSDTGAK